MMVINAWSRFFCRVVVSTCGLTHNIAPHISLHDPPYHKTMKKYEDFEGMVVSLFPPRKFWIQAWFCNCQKYLCLFHIVFEYIPGVHYQGKMLVLPKSTSLLSTFHIGSMFCFFPANLMSSTYTDKNNPLSRCMKKHSKLETFSQPYFNRIFQIAFPITVLPKDDRTDFAQEERLDLPYWTMIQAICVVVDESKSLDIPIWEFSIILEHLPFFLGISRYCISCLSCAPWQSGYDIHDFCCCHL